MKKYFVSKNSQIKGPFDLEQIKTSLLSNDLCLSDNIYDEAEDKWQPIGELSEFQGEVSLEDNSEVIEEKIFTITQKETNEISNSNEIEWYVLRGESKSGPFEYKSLIQMLQERQLFEYDFVWNENMKNWARIAELRDFSPERIRDFYKKNKSEFFKRAYPRVKLGGDLLVHDNFKIWKGENLLISEGGCCVKVENSMIQPGDEVFIHFKPNGDLDPFNAKGEVVGKKYDPTIKDIEHPIVYGVKFKNIKDEYVKQIRRFSKKSA